MRAVKTKTHATKTHVLTTILTATVAVSMTGISQAKADLDPALCGLGGAALGGVIGHQFGGGSGKDAMTVIGAIAGAVGAAQYCKQAQNSQDISNARNYERRALESGGPVEWSNPQYGRGVNSRSHIEKRGWHGQRECTMTRSVMSDQRGRYVNETVWCNDRGQWVQVTETTTIRQIQWGPRGLVETATTTTTTAGRPGVPMTPPVITPPRAERLPYWIISENRAANIAREIRRASDRERVHVARNNARDLARDQQFLTLDQLGEVLRTVPSDTVKHQILLVLVDSVDQRYGSVSNAVSAFKQNSAREQARRVLSGGGRDGRSEGRTDGPRDARRDDHRDDRRDSRNGDPRHQGPIGRTR